MSDPTPTGITYSVALVDMVKCRDTLGREGVKRLLDAGISCLDLRLPSGLFGAEFEALADLAQWTWELGGDVAVHSWEGRFDGDKATADGPEGVKDAQSVVRRIKALEAAVLARLRRGDSDTALWIVTRWRDKQREAGDAKWMTYDADVALERAIRVKVYRANFERDVWRGKSAGGDKRFANPLADDYIDRFFSTFYDELRTCFADYLGFGNPDGHYVNSDLDGDGHQDDTIPADLPSRVRRAALMVYQSAEADMRAVITKNRAPWGDLDLSLYVASGRIDKSTGQVGSLKAIKAIVRNPPKGVVEIVFYIGFGAEGQLLTGHAGFPAVVEAVPELVREVA